MSGSLPTQSTRCVTVLHYFAHPLATLPHAETSSRYSSRGSENARKVHEPALRRGLCRPLLFYTTSNRESPGAAWGRGKVARAICPRPDCGPRRATWRGTHKNQAPKALPSWHASTSQPLSLNRITSRGLQDGISSSILSFIARRSVASALFSSLSLSHLLPQLLALLPPTYLNSRIREAVLFLKLVLLLLLGSTCRHHPGVFVLANASAQPWSRRGPWPRKKNTLGYKQMDAGSTTSTSIRRTIIIEDRFIADFPMDELPPSCSSLTEFSDGNLIGISLLLVLFVLGSRDVAQSKRRPLAREFCSRIRGPFVRAECNSPIWSSWLKSV